MTSSRSISSRNGSTDANGVAGFKRQAGAATGVANLLQGFADIVFRFRFDVDRDRIRAGFDETRHVMIGMLDHEMNIERKLVCLRTVATMRGPNEMLSTKWPSMMSRWIQSAPASSTRRISRPDREKSAARIEGATRIGATWSNGVME